MNMISDKLEKQLTYLQEAITIAKFMIENYKRQNEEKNEEFGKLGAECQRLNSRIYELESKKCDSCEVLHKKLLELQKLNKSANSRLKSIATLLRPDEGGQTNILTDAQLSRMTQILENSPKVNQEKKRKFTPLISEKEDLQTNNKQNLKIIVPETPDICETQLQNVVGIVVPETQFENESQYQKDCSSVDQSNSNPDGSLVPQNNALLKNDGGIVKRHKSERLARSPLSNGLWTRLKVDKSAIPKSHNEYKEQKVTVKPTEIENSQLKKLVNQTEERMISHTSQETVNNKVQGSNMFRHAKRELSFDKISQKATSVFPKDSKLQKDSVMKKETFWKLKPSLLIQSSNSDKQNKCSKSKQNLKQTTLSVGAIEKKQDISVLENFNGGVVNSCTEDKDYDSDVIFDSPKHKEKKVSSRIQLKLGTKDLEETLFLHPSTSTRFPKNEVNCKSSELTLKLETNDLDETLFQPPITSTCISPSSVDNSYDRLPELPKSPDFKHKKERKKEERMKLPGWSCNECDKYYEISGQSLNKDEIRQKMNTCSRHRDKYQLRPRTPPGFWDPVIPPS